MLVPGFVSHVEAAWDWPYLARFLHRLASFSRLILFDKRGTGLSDPMKRPPTLSERVDDIRAVMDAVGVERAHLFGVSEGGALSIAFATQHPQRVESLILYGSYPRKVATADYPWGVSHQTVAQFLKRFDEAWASGAWWDIVNPDLPLDPDTQRWWARYLRVGASPGMARDLMLMNAKIDVRSLLPGIHSPTLVLHRVDDRWVDVGNGRYLADHIAGAKLAELPGADHRPWVETPTPCSIRCKPPFAARSTAPATPILLSGCMRSAAASTRLSGSPSLASQRRTSPGICFSANAPSKRTCATLTRNST